MTDSPFLAVDGLEVAYRSGRRQTTVLHEVGFELAQGQVLALVGESGSGKTTTGHAILGLLPDNGDVVAGSIRLRGRELTDLTTQQWRELRGSVVSLIPQDPAVSLDPVRRVGPQVEDALRLHTDFTAEERRERVHELFRLVGFDDVETRYRQYPHELSGGMQQRVLIAAAVAAGPDLIIADEPTSGLDATVQKQVLDLIEDLRRTSGTSIILVTHDLGVAADRSDLIGVMHHGRLVEFGPTPQVVAAPGHPYTRHLLDSVPSRSLGRRRPRAGDAAGTGVSGSGNSEPGSSVSANPGPREPVIEVTGLRKHYGDLTAVDDISFSVDRGETFAIVGESGSGKSTTARILTGLTPASAGSVQLLGTELTGLSHRGFRPLRRDIQIVHQNPYSSFDPRFSVFDVVEEPLRAFGESTRRNRPETRDRVAAALEAAALPADFARRHPRELSGGQRQRVAIARALVLRPTVVVLDEPISALDVSVAAQILELLRQLQEELGLTYVFISHDLAVVAAVADRIAVMRRGRIVEQGHAADVFTDPKDAYTVDLLDAIAGRDLHDHLAGQFAGQGALR